MLPLCQTIRDFHSASDVLRRRAYGVIETADEQVVGIHLKPWPKIASVVEAWWHERRFHRREAGNRCWLYYNQPRSCPNFLALAYVVSSRDTTLATFRLALAVLDEVARIKQTDAIVCEASNWRISDRLASRWGWARHVPTSSRRHFIKRFYGVYPAPAHRIG